MVASWGEVQTESDHRRIPQDRKKNSLYLSQIAQASCLVFLYNSGAPALSQTDFTLAVVATSTEILVRWGVWVECDCG